MSYEVHDIRCFASCNPPSELFYDVSYGHESFIFVQKRAILKLVQFYDIQHNKQTDHLLTMYVNLSFWPASLRTKRIRFLHLLVFP